MVNNINCCWMQRTESKIRSAWIQNIRNSCQDPRFKIYTAQCIPSKDVFNVKWCGFLQYLPLSFLSLCTFSSLSLLIYCRDRIRMPQCHTCSLVYTHIHPWNRSSEGKCLIQHTEKSICVFTKIYLFSSYVEPHAQAKTTIINAPLRRYVYLCFPTILTER